MAYTFLSGGSVSAQDWRTASDERKKQTQVVQVKQQQAKKKQQQDDEEKARQNSLLNKVTRVATTVGNVGKSVGKAAVTSEKTAATGIARIRPGGLADSNAAVKESDQAAKTAVQASQELKAGKINKAQALRRSSIANTSSKESQQNLKDVNKSMPTKGQLAAGFAGTAADIISGGTLSAASNSVKAGKAVKVAEDASKASSLFNKAKKLAKTGKAAAPMIAANSASAGFNAAAGGGDKVEVAKNAAAGAALPLGLEAVGHLTAKALDDVMGKVKAPKKLLDQAKQKSLLDKATAETAEKNKVAASKVDQKIELIEAKKADGKFTNVDQVKVKQLKEEKQQLTGGSDAPTTPTAQLPDGVKPAKVGTPPVEVSSKGSIAPAPKAATIETQPLKQTNEIPTTSQTAGKPATTAAVEPLTSTPQGTSKIGNSTLENAVGKSLKKKYGEAAQYDKITIADQAKKAVALTEDKAQLERVISGEAPLPDGLRATALIDAIERHPVLGKDVDLLIKLSKSPLASESSYSAQELRLAAERVNHSPIEAMKAIRAVREKAAEKKLKKSAAKAVSDEIRQIRTTKPRVTKETFESFVESLKC